MALKLLGDRAGLLTNGLGNYSSMEAFKFPTEMHVTSSQPPTWPKYIRDLLPQAVGFPAAMHSEMPFRELASNGLAGNKHVDELNTRATLPGTAKMHGEG